MSGGPGGAVAIRCRYSPLSINKHARKYWCRISPVTRVCHTVVSTTNYTRLGYRGRVALADYPQGGLFVVTLSRLSPEDVGRYRCGIGNRNNMFFSSMNLTVSTGMGWWVKFGEVNAGSGMGRCGSRWTGPRGLQAWGRAVRRKSWG